MKSLFLLILLCVMASLAVCFESCSFREELPVRQTPNNLACYSSILLCRAGLSSISPTRIKSLDIFVYNDSSDGTLDSYEHLDLNGNENYGITPEALDISSSSGYKRLVIVANMQTASLSYHQIVNYRQFSLLLSSLYDERAFCPVMTGECTLKAGLGKSHGLTLFPLASRIRIRSFEVDFSGKSYSDLTLESPRAYIVNANASCRYLCDQATVATDFINFRYLDEACTESLKSPELLLYEGKNLQECALFCYPRAKVSGEDNPTMLVIEGTVGGNLCYYPFVFGDGAVQRATDYIFDIKLTRIGATTPQEPVSSEDCMIQLSIEKWKEYEWETVDY